MLKSILQPAGDAARFADPGEIVRAREAIGWSREQLAGIWVFICICSLLFGWVFGRVYQPLGEFDDPPPVPAR